MTTIATRLVASSPVEHSASVGDDYRGKPSAFAWLLVNDVTIYVDDASALERLSDAVFALGMAMSKARDLVDHGVSPVAAYDLDREHKALERDL